jgi:fatty acid desaturase
MTRFWPQGAGMHGNSRAVQLDLMMKFDSTLSISWGSSVGRDRFALDEYLHPQTKTKETFMLLWIAIIIGVLWLVGLIGGIGGGLIHLLLVVAVVVLVFHFIRGRSRV